MLDDGKDIVEQMKRDLKRDGFGDQPDLVYVGRLVTFDGRSG